MSPGSLRSSGLLLAHELGHVFGGIDREEAGGLMNPRVRGDRIDDVNATLMRLHVRRRFHTGDPLPPALTGRAAVLYATAARTLTGAGAIQARSRAVLLSLRLADVHLTRERWQEAASSLERALELDEGIADAWVNLGAARLRLGELDRSESATRRALELRPSHPQALLNLGVVTARRLDLRGAAHFYAMAAQVEPTYAEAHLNLGHAHLAFGEPDAAERAYRRALALGGPAGLIHSGLALVHMARNERQLADAELRTAIELGFDLSGETPGMSIGRVAVPSRGWKGDGRHEPRPPEARRDFP